MVKLLIIADDFTGALDTGVQFSKFGIRTMVTAVSETDLNKVDKELDVLVIDTESRYLTFEEAYQRLKNIIIAAQNADIPYIYKKVDSALRGNISAEIKAILDFSSKQTIPFLPAYPEMERVVIDGHLFIDEQLVSDSIFAHDPYEPVTESNISLRLKKEGDIDTTLVKNSYIPHEATGLLLFDSTSDADLKKQLTALDERDLLPISIGCAGFAKVLSQHLFNKHELIDYHLEAPIVVISGSVNDITKKQIEYAEEKKFPRLSLTVDQLLTTNYWESKQGRRDIKHYLDLIEEHSLVVFETLSDKTMQQIKQIETTSASDDSTIRFNIGQSLGLLTKSLWENHSKGTFLFTGGDTLFQSMKVLGVNDIQPLVEMSTGVVLSSIKWKEKEIQVITKSGGFGHQELLEDMIHSRL